MSLKRLMPSVVPAWAGTSGENYVLGFQVGTPAFRPAPDPPPGRALRTHLGSGAGLTFCDIDRDFF